MKVIIINLNNFLIKIHNKNNKNNKVKYVKKEIFKDKLSNKRVVLPKKINQNLKMIMNNSQRRKIK